jgi:type IX secretion system PorP/SprF family membrane protein
MKIKIVLTIFFLLTIKIFSQDVSFSQYNAARLYLNPAFSGTDSALLISTGYRNQWPKMSSPYQSFYFSADNYYHFMSAGFGFNYIQDYEMNGVFTKTRYEFNWSPHITLFHKRAVLKLGFQAAYCENKVDWSKLVYGDQIDPSHGFIHNTWEVPGRSKKSYADFTQGFLIYSNHYYGGVVVSHITEPDVGMISTSKLPIKLTIHSGANLFFKKDSLHRFTLSPNILFIDQPLNGDFNSTTGMIFLPGITAKYKWISLGLSFRSNDAFIVTAAFQNRFLRVGYSYDYTEFGLTNKTTGGSHEVHLTWYLRYRKKISKIKTLRLI